MSDRQSENLVDLLGRAKDRGHIGIEDGRVDAARLRSRSKPIRFQMLKNSASYSGLSSSTPEAAFFIEFLLAGYKQDGQRFDGLYVHPCDTVRTMVKKLTKTGNSFALVLDKPLLQQLGIDEDTELEISTNGDVLVVTPVRGRSRERKFQQAVQKINERYAGLFKRLSE